MDFDLSSVLGSAAAVSSADLAPGVVPHPTDAELRALAAQCREASPPSLQSGFKAPPDRRDPVEMLLEQERLQGRDEDLLPLRRARMAVSPFTFYRGAARIMAFDLAGTPTSGLPHQWICGDAHLLNFGMFGSKERQLVYDLNDFDETSVAPAEWDVKRLATSLIIASRNNGFSSDDAKMCTLEMLASYRTSLAKFSQMTHLELFYVQLPVNNALAALNFHLHDPADAVKKKKKKKKGKKKKKKGKKKKKKHGHESSDDGEDDNDNDNDNDDDSADSEDNDDNDNDTTTSYMEEERTAYRNAPSGLPWTQKVIRKALRSDHHKAAEKLMVKDEMRFASDPPILTPIEQMDLAAGRSREEVLEALAPIRRAYRESLPHARRHLLEQYELHDVARKVVGVGSVGTRCYVALFSGCDPNDILILQAKQACKSVIEEVLPMPKPFSNHGERVVAGQQILQATHDIFLGFSPGADTKDGGRRHFYWRQLKDLKGCVEVDRLDATGMAQYARLCGWTLARAHAKSAVANGRALSYWMGNDDSFDRAMCKFAEDYADQNQQDYNTFIEAIKTGRITAQEQPQ